MGTTVEKLNKVLETKEAIRTAINNKGGTLTESDTFSSYSAAIDNIQTGSGENPLQYVVDNHEGDGKPSCYYLFYFYNGTSLDNVLKSLDFSKVTNMNGMFYNCQNLTSIPQLDTSKVNNMSYMFYDCYKLTSIPQLDTSKVTNMDSMFYSCSSLTSIPQLDTSKVTDMSYMFYDCYKLEKIDITKLASTDAFAYNCYSLKILIIRTMNKIPSLSSIAFNHCYHFYGTKNSTYNPEELKDGAIYVPDDKVEELKVATNWSIFADIIKPLSEYVEE